MEADFSGYATKAGLKCSDGRTIMKEAFQHMDGKKVPLVWQHSINDPKNVLGHALLEYRDEKHADGAGMYAYGFFNSTESAKGSKVLVVHGDITSLSIRANQLVERAKQVFHGVIQEVSLVLSGANPGALIDNISIEHSDGDIETLDDAAIIYTGLEIKHTEDEQLEEIEHAEDDGKTVQDVYDGFSEEEKQVVHYMIGAALEAQDAGDVSQSDIDTNDEGDLNHQEGNDEMSRNVFEDNEGAAPAPTKRQTLTHDQLNTIVDDAKRLGSLKESFLMHAVDYGIENIDYLFPDARNVQDSPEFISRRMEWVSKVITGTKHSPFSRIKTLSADITHDEARAKGYVKGNLKKEEWFKLEKRVTTPTTIYKKQKLDRDDIIDITDLDVVAWLKAEMRVMLDEEIARAILVGDGREVDDEDKIDEDCIRPIAYDDDFYTQKVQVPANTTPNSLVEAVLRSRINYRGSGQPTFFLSPELLVDLLLDKDNDDRRRYDGPAGVAAAMGVKELVPVDILSNATAADGGELLGVLVNLTDYTAGADKGGSIAMFDDFDIDYNQYKYLMEGRMSGALTKFASATAFSRAGGGTKVVPTAPTFVPATGVVTIPTVAGVTYKNGSGTTLTAGPQTALTSGQTLEVVATANSGNYFAHNTDTDWEFTRP